MKNRSNKKFPLVIAVILVVIILGGGVFAYFKWFRGEKEQFDVSAWALEFDYALENGFHAKGKDLLEKIRDYSGNSKSWLRILKRVEAFSRGVDDYSVLEKYADIARKDLPGNEDLRAVYTYSLLRQGAYVKAYEHAKKHLESNKYHSLIAEAAIKAGPAEYDPKDLKDNEYFPFLEDSFKGNPRIYEELAEEFKDDTLFAATAIAWMMEGNIEKAVENIIQTEGESYKLLKYYIYYDYGEYANALPILRELQYNPEFNYIESLLLEADVQMAMGDFKAATATYANVIEEDPEASWIPYLNLAWIKMQEKNYEEAAGYLISGYELFPKKDEVETAVSIFLLQITRINIDADVLEFLEEALRDHREMYRVYKQAVQASKSPERYKAVLWELFNIHPENVKIAQFFAWYLIGIRDMNDLALVLEKSTERYGQMEWIDFFHGCINAVHGKMETAGEHFTKAMEKIDRWETAYNMALISLQYGDTDKALEYFRKAESKISSQKEQYAGTIAQIRVKMAWILYANEQYEAAKRQISYALEIDSGNLEGQLLRKKLEAETKR